MTSRLGRLLGADQKGAMALLELRNMTRDDSDVRLFADVLARAHSIIRALGLDPKDATAEEIYQTLKAAAPKVEETACFKASDWVLLEVDGQVISFNPVDVVNNYHYELPLGEHQTSEAKRGLGFEITKRYKDHPNTHSPRVEQVVCDGGICWIESVATNGRSK